MKIINFSIFRVGPLGLFLIELGPTLEMEIPSFEIYNRRRMLLGNDTPHGTIEVLSGPNPEQDWTPRIDQFRAQYPEHMDWAHHEINVKPSAHEPLILGR